MFYHIKKKKESIENRIIEQKIVDNTGSTQLKSD